jgi:predicted Zn-dependent protease
VAARHTAQVLAKAQALQITAAPAYLVLGHWPGPRAHGGTGSGPGLALTTIIREAENEADQLGIQYLWNSGYDAAAYIAFLEKFLERGKDQPAQRPGFFRVLPDTRDRIAASMNELRHLPVKDRYVIDSSEFERVKQRLRTLGAARD